MEARRRKFSVREEAFAVQWEYENVPRGGIGSGLGILQGLMFKPTSRGSPWDLVICRAWIRNREAAIVATIVQWLGTNVGWCFLEQSLRRCGWRLARIRHEDSDSLWVPAAERLPAEAGRYLVETSYGGTEEAMFLPGSVRGSNGLWTSYDGRTRLTIVRWWEPLRFHDWGARAPYRRAA